MPEMHEFYDAFFPRLEEAIDYCDKFGLDDLPDDALNLLHLIYSLIMVAMAVEIMHQPAPIDAADAVMIRTDEPVPVTQTMKGQTMSLLTITKLSESVGAEVTGMDPTHLALGRPGR